MKTLEIERRFHLMRLPDFTTEILWIEQYYNPLENGDIKRYRQTKNTYTKEVTFEEIIKRNLSKGINEEEHFEISKEEFKYNTLGIRNLKYIGKYRYIYRIKNFKFEIDKFHNIDLIICEVELPSIDTEIIFPDFIKELVIKEITGEQEYSNYNLARKLF